MVASTVSQSPSGHGQHSLTNRHLKVTYTPYRIVESRGTVNQPTTPTREIAADAANQNSDREVLLGGHMISYLV